MLSLDAKNVFLIGGAAVAVLAGAYVIWGPSERKRRKANSRGTFTVVSVTMSTRFIYCGLGIGLGLS